MSTPATLPANFDKWDDSKGKTPPSTLPPNFAGWDNTETTSTGIVVPKGMIGETPGYFKEAFAGVGRGVSGVGSFIKQTLTPHDTAGGMSREENAKIGPVGRLLYNIPADLVRGLETAEGARQQSQRRGEGAAGQSLSYLENSPVGGIVKKAEEAGPGYAKFAPATLGAVTEAGTAYALPKVAGTVIGTPAEARARLQPFLRKSLGIEQGLEGDATKAATKYGEDVAARKIKHRETIEDNLRTQREARTKIDQDKLAVGEANKKIEAENKAAQEKVEQRGKLEKQVDEQSVKAHKKIEQVEKAVYEEGNRKFNEVRGKIGNPEIDPKNLVDNVRSVQVSVLQGIPENVKEFRAILEHEPLPESVKSAAEAAAKQQGFDLEGEEPLTWDKLQSLKSRLDARLRSRTPMNGDLRRALGIVRETVVGEMGQAADKAGAGGLWSDARNWWRNYKEDFEEATGPSQSGSPVAQALNAKDPSNMRAPFLRTQSTIGNRALDILRKYPNHGGTDATAAVEEMIENHKSMLDLPKKATPTELKSPKEAIQLPQNKPMPKMIEKPVVDAQATALRQILSKSKNIGTFNARDVGILASSIIAGPIIKILSGKLGQDASSLLPEAAVTYEGGKYAASRLLRNPKVAEWLSRTPPEEARALRDILDKMPGGDKVKVINMLTEEAKAAAKGGKLLQLSAQAKQLLGSSNVAAITAAGASNAVKTPGEAKDRLREFAPTPQ